MNKTTKLEESQLPEAEREGLNRGDAGPRYGGGAWKIADERRKLRNGHTRNDDANPSGPASNDADNADDESPTRVDPALAAAEASGEIQGSSEHAGMGRGDHPRQSKTRAT